MDKSSSPNASEVVAGKHINRRYGRRTRQPKAKKLGKLFAETVNCHVIWLNAILIKERVCAFGSEAWCKGYMKPQTVLC